MRSFLQFTETEKVRFIGPEDSSGAKEWLGKFRYMEDIPAGSYKNQVNDGPVTSMNTAVGIAVNKNLSEDVVYRMTKAFWDNIDKVTSTAPWAKALDVKYAAKPQGLITMHPVQRALQRNRRYVKTGTLPFLYGAKMFFAQGG